MTKQERLEKQMQRLEEMKQPEAELHAAGYRFIAGVDEVGRGPLAGPVVAAAVILPEDFDVLGIDDSKKLSEKKRDELYDVIRDKAVAYGIGMADEKVIDEINILQATKVAMKQAIAELQENLKANCSSGTEGALGSAANCSTDIDGNSQDGDLSVHAQIDYILFDAMKIEEVQIPQESVIKGDAKVLAIAAASILAKVTRDRMMVEYAQEYPGYAFEKNKGYGTKAHYEGIKVNGICAIHRRTFLKNILGE